MKTDEKYIKDLHKEHLEFISSLNFYKDELVTFTHRLEEIARANTKKEIMEQVEKFQNHFIRQKEVLDELVSKINSHEHELVENAKANNVATDHRKVNDHGEIRNEFHTYEKIYNELKLDFQTFLSKYF